MQALLELPVVVHTKDGGEPLSQHCNNGDKGYIVSPYELADLTSYTSRPQLSEWLRAFSAQKRDITPHIHVIRYGQTSLRRVPLKEYAPDAVHAN